MTELVVRRLLIDLQTPFAARWCGGDAFRSAFFNALSMSFPVGEQYFIDSVRRGLQALPDDKRQDLAPEVQAFIGQEATHRRLHSLFNAHLEQQGLHNGIAARAAARIRRQAGYDLRNHVAGTAATEHFTALFADWLLRHPEVLDGAEPRLKLLWQWHSAEESEHRSTAFDVYQRLGGSHLWRVRVFRYVSVVFLVDVLLQTLHNLWRGGSWWHARTWLSGWRVLMSRDGLLRGNFGGWRAYTDRGFHPRQLDDRLSREWLQAHARDFTVVGPVSASAPAGVTA
jgi:predicted metal-dependent hydrolase